MAKARKNRSFAPRGRLGWGELSKLDIIHANAINLMINNLQMIFY